jgi:hypothetical protein
MPNARGKAVKIAIYSGEDAGIRVADALEVATLPEIRGFAAHRRPHLAATRL